MEVVLSILQMNFGAIDNKNISYILDIKSNAKGFEQMGIMAIKKKNGR